jgi:signal transduction histidine kinase
LNEARRSVWNLRPEALEQLSLTEVLNQEVNKFSQSSGIKAQFDDSDEQREISHEKELALLRICQESLANVRKHAQATEVKVSLTFDESTATLTVRDNGVGMKTEIGEGEPKSKHRGFGLISMRERTRNLGGTLEVQSEKGKGTLIRATIPV